MPGYALRGNLPPADPAAAHRVCRSESPRKDSPAARILHLAVHGMMERGTTPPRASAGAVLEVSHSEATGGPAAGSLSVDTQVLGESFCVGGFFGGMNDLSGMAGRTAGVGISEGTAVKSVKAGVVKGNGTGPCITVAADMVCSPVASTHVAGGIPGPACLRRKSGWANGVSVVPVRGYAARCTVATDGSLSVDTPVPGESFGVGGFFGGMNDLSGMAGRTAGVCISAGTAAKSVNAGVVKGNGTYPCITVAADMVCSPVASTPAAGGIPGPACLRRKSGWANGVSVVPGRVDAARCTVAADGKADRVAVMVPRGVAAGTCRAGLTGYRRP